LKLFNQRLGLRDIKASDLDAVHRLGKKQEGPRAIIVRFLSRKIRSEVITKRRLLKKKPGQTARPVTIVEDLTKTNYLLYRRARMTEGVKECWTTMGKILIKTHSGLTKRIRRLSDLAELDNPDIIPQSQEGRMKALRPQPLHHRSRTQGEKRSGRDDAQGPRGRDEARRLRGAEPGYRGRGGGRGHSGHSKHLGRFHRNDHQRSPSHSSGNEWMTEGDYDEYNSEHSTNWN